MAYETSKCHNLRLVRGDFNRYIRGNILDIGCGPDPVQPPNGIVTPWDLPNGDATFLETVEDNTFDCVYSSHCLEHLSDVVIALKNWVRVTRNQGYLYITVPDFIIYEKGNFPSHFNPGHHFTFSISKTRVQVNRSSHYSVIQDILPIMAELGCEPIRIDFEDNGYDYSRHEVDQTYEKGWDDTQIDHRDTPNFALSQICTIWRKKGTK